MKLSELKHIYIQAAEKMLQDQTYWQDFLQYAGKMYGYSFPTLVSTFAQNTEYTQLATYEAWNKLSLQIKRGEKSIPALFHNRFGMVHMFDVSQLSTAPQTKNWVIGKNEREEFEKRFVKANHKYVEQGMLKNTSDIIYAMIVEQMDHIYTKNKDIRDLLINNGSCIFEDVHYMVSRRCNGQEAENSSIRLNNSLNLDEFTAYGQFVMTIGKPILLNCKNIVYEMRKEQLNEGEAARREDRNRLYREGRNPVRRREGGTGREVHNETRQVRNTGNELLEREQGNTASNSGDKRNNDEDHARDRGQSQSDDGRTAEKNAETGSGEESTEHNGELQAQTEDTRPGRGNRVERSSVQIELNFDNLKLNIEAEKGVDDVTTPFLLHAQADEKHNYHYEESHNLYSEKSFQYEDELQSKLKRQAELNELLEMDKNVEVLDDGESLDKEVVEKLREVIDEAMNMQHEEIALEP